MRFSIGLLLLAAIAGLAYVVRRRRRGTAVAESPIQPLSDPADTYAAAASTGMPARAQAEAQLDIEFAAAQRGRPLAVILVEPDNLDAYHLINGATAVAGVLRSLATLLRQHTRRMDVSAVYGTRSFVSILSGSREDGALIFATRIQEQLHSAQTLVSLPNVSIGIACYRHDMETARSLLDAAERALALARRDGGDRIRIFDRTLVAPVEPASASEPPVAGHHAAESDSAPVQERQLAVEMRARNRELQQAVAASEARFHEVVNTIHEVIFVTDVEGRWQFLNRAWSMITGFTVEECIGRDMFEFVQRDDVPELRAAFDDVVHAAAAYYRHECQWRTRAGGYCWMELRLQPTIQHGKVTGTTGILLDLSDRRRADEAQQRSEAYFRALIENSADVLTAVNPDGTIRYVSPAIEALLGYPAAAFIGRNAFELVHPDDLEPAREELQRLLTDQSEAADMDVRMRHRAGHWVLLELSGRNLLHASVIGAVIISARDATARRRIESALRESEEAALRTQKMDAIARLAAGVAGEYEEQLRAIQAQTELLFTRYAADVEARAAVEQVFNAVTHASAITQRLRAVGRQQPQQPATIDLNGLIAALAPRVQRLLGEGVLLVTELGAEAAFVRADPAELEQVIFSLAHNARATMGDGGVLTIGTARYTVRPNDALRRELDVGSYTALTIGDTGTGMDAAQLAHAFEPFFTSAQTSDHGLGLAAVYGMIRQAGGHVAVESELGRGTRVTLYLPTVTANTGVYSAEPLAPLNRAG